MANGGWETFLSYEDPRQDILIGLLRLRKCSAETFRAELKGRACSIVRELHVYGSAVPVSARDPTKFQHQVRCSCVLGAELVTEVYPQVVVDFLKMGVGLRIILNNGAGWSANNLHSFFCPGFHQSLHFEVFFEHVHV